MCRKWRNDSALLLQHGDFRPAGGAFGEFSGGEAPDDELLVLDPFDSVLHS